MAKFNQTSRGADKTTNHEGAVAYKLSPELELYSTAVTAILSDKFYESENDTLERIKALLPKVSPEFVAKLAVYARTKMYLRSLPLVLTTELAKVHSGDDLVSRTVGHVVQRADEITELLAYYAASNGRSDTKKLGKLSKQIQKGLAGAFNRFDEYQFGKYNRDGAVKLRDALFLVHPKAKNDEQQKLFDKIVADELAVPYTWEVELSKGENKKETWEALIDSGKLGYMAMLRNLRNIIEAEVSQKHLGAVCARLSDAEEVAKSKQFPFRFLSAYRMLKPIASGKVSMVLDALEEAMIHSAQNIKGFDYNTAVTIACDVSGSMQSQISERSVVQQFDIGLCLGMLLHHKCKNVETGMFGEQWKVINLPKNNILANADEFHQREGEVGYATNGYLVIRDLIARGEVKDKVMIFTDCQMWDSHWGGDEHIAEMWGKYKTEVAPNAKLYLFDLSGYGNTPVSVRENGVHLIAGWSDKVFDMLDAYEKGSDAIAEIQNIQI